MIPHTINWKKWKAIFLIVCVSYLLSFAHEAQASETNGTIVSGTDIGYAWSDQIGWVNFSADTGHLAITDTGITGYAWSTQASWLNMAPQNGGVHIDAHGALSGFAWGSGVVWVDFSGVSISSGGKFTGQATGATIGTLTFDCTHCDVSTDYRPLSFRTSSSTTHPHSNSSTTAPIYIPSPVYIPTQAPRPTDGPPSDGTRPTTHIDNNSTSTPVEEGTSSPSKPIKNTATPQTQPQTHAVTVPSTSTQGILQRISNIAFSHPITTRVSFGIFFLVLIGLVYFFLLVK